MQAHHIFSFLFILMHITSYGAAHREVYKIRSLSEESEPISPRAKTLAALAAELDKAADPMDTEASQKIEGLLGQIGSNFDELHRGLTLLARAAINGYEKVVMFLCERGASVNIRVRSNSTALHAAATFGSPEIIAILLAKGADPTLQDTSGRTPLHKALISQKEEAAIKLIDAGSPLDAKDSFGDTPRFLAESKHMQRVIASIREKTVQNQS